MSHRSRLLHDRAALQAASPLAFPNMQPRPAPPAPQQVSLDQLVPMLISQGADRGCRLHHDAIAGVIRIIMHCGPLVIPFDLTVDQAREFAAALDSTAEAIAPEPVDPEPVVVSVDAEALLAEFIAAAAADAPQAGG